MSTLPLAIGYFFPPAEPGVVFDGQDGMKRECARRTPFSYSFFVGLVFCDSVQIRLNVAIQNEVCIGQRVVVDEIVQL